MIPNIVFVSPQGREQLVRSLIDDYRTRSPYVAYLVRSRQGLLTTIAHLEKLLSRIKADSLVVMSSIVGVCVRMFLERREHCLGRFTRDFTILTVPDEKVQLVENFLTQLHSELERDPMWISSTRDQLDAAELVLERVVMSHIYIHALYPNGDGDVSRDQ
ncbi:GTPase-activating protein and VPS9 domain-containing protein 1 [Chionoecetes opilio]|uniref:GTPase-activating protein and VPS9 domain-containing protein 1 n=1 Tax=Chionoecetes opilio TaxID=41210 RepID=A0A8J4Y3V8_CHIOP|nr:GTPase-activating protein and VPS9 domain-containing protein 1 [Chionoecetes opilio]